MPESHLLLAPIREFRSRAPELLALTKQERTDRAVTLLVQTGQLQLACDLLIDSDSWERALALAPGVSLELYDDVAATFWHHGHLMKKSDWYQWIMEEGHVDCAFELAERAASVMAVDEVRIDVFITKGDPEGCKINENSLSSGMIYGPQWGFMAKLWAEPYIRKEYKTFSLDEKRIYEQTVDDVPGLRQRLEKAGKKN